MPMSPRLLRPRASGAFDPRSLPGLVFWLDGEDEKTMFNATSGGSQVAPGGNILRWADKSGNNNHAVRWSASINTPTLASAAVNGRSAVLFPGGGNTTLYVPTGNLPQPLTYFSVWQSNAVPAGPMFDSVSRIALGSYGSQQQMAHFAGSTINYTLQSVQVAGIPQVWTVRYSQSPSHSVRANGRDIPLIATGGTNGTGTWVNIGNDVNFNGSYNGHCCEHILVSGALPDATVQQIEGYLADKWGVRTALPSSHSRFSAFSPPRQSDLKLWLDASDIDTLATNTNGTGSVTPGSPVRYWGDKSGNGGHVTQTGSTAILPTFLESSNGVRSVSFDGADWLTNTSPLSITPCTAFVVMRVLNSGIGAVLALYKTGFGDWNVNGAGMMFVSTSAGNAISFHGNTISFNNTLFPSTPDNATEGIFQMAVASANDASLTIRRNAVESVQTDTTYQTAGPSDGIIVGGRVSGWPPMQNGFVGRVYEIMWYDAMLNATERAGVYNYLRSKWYVG